MLTGVRLRVCDHPGCPCRSGQCRNHAPRSARRGVAGAQLRWAPCIRFKQHLPRARTVQLVALRKVRGPRLGARRALPCPHRPQHCESTCRPRAPPCAELYDNVPGWHRGNGRWMLARYRTSVRAWWTGGLSNPWWAVGLSNPHTLHWVLSAGRIGRRRRVPGTRHR